MAKKEEIDLVGKKRMLEQEMKTFIDDVLDKAQSNGELDFISIEITNHKGNLQMDYGLRGRKKAY